MLRMCFVRGVLRRVGRGMRGYVDFPSKPPFLGKRGSARIFQVDARKQSLSGWIAQLWIYQK